MLHETHSLATNTSSTRKAIFDMGDGGIVHCASLDV